MTTEPIIDEQGRPEPPFDADEERTVVGFLDFQRATLRWKCDGLADDGFRATTAASSMTLGGVLRHMNFVEDYWFNTMFAGKSPTPPWDAVDWNADADWDWRSASNVTGDLLLAEWGEAVRRSRTIVSAALISGGLDQQAARGWSTGGTPNLRWIMLHMIEEYARHNGHADLLREAADGGAIGE